MIINNQWHVDLTEHERGLDQSLTIDPNVTSIMSRSLFVDLLTNLHYEHLKSEQIDLYLAVTFTLNRSKAITTSPVKLILISLAFNILPIYRYSDM